MSTIQFSSSQGSLSGAKIVVENVTQCIIGNAATSALHSSFQNTHVPLDLKQKVDKDHPLDTDRVAQFDALKVKLEEVWDLARKAVMNKGATSDLEINYSQLTIFYKIGDEVHTIDKIHLDSTLRELMSKVQKLSMEIWEVQNPDDFYNASIGSLTGGEPFQVIHPSWQKELLAKPGDFFADREKHFGAMIGCGYLQNRDDQQGAFDSIVASIAFQNKLIKAVKENLDTLQNEMHAGQFQGKPSAEKRETESDFHALSEMYSKLVNLKHDAVCSALAIWGNTDVATANDKTRLGKARTASEWQRDSLLTRLKPLGAADERAWHTKLWDWGSSQNNIYTSPMNLLLGMKSCINNYANQTGDLLLSERPQALLRIRENGDRSMEKACMEHLVVQNTIHAGQQHTAQNVYKTLNDTGLQFSPSVRGALAQAMIEGRKEAETARVKAKTISTRANTTWETWVTDAQKDKLLESSVRP